MTDVATDGWAPWGPAIVTKDLIPDPQVLNIWTRRNGVIQQNATTGDMISIYDSSRRILAVRLSSLTFTVTDGINRISQRVSSAHALREPD